MKKLLAILTLGALTLTGTAAVALPRGREGHAGRVEPREGVPHRRFAPDPFVSPAIVGGLIAGGLLASRCGLEPGYWTQQPYADPWGRVTYEWVWVPARWACD